MVNNFLYIKIEFDLDKNNISSYNLSNECYAFCDEILYRLYVFWGVVSASYMAIIRRVKFQILLCKVIIVGYPLAQLRVSE